MAERGGREKAFKIYAPSRATASRSFAAAAEDERNECFPMNQRSSSLPPSLASSACRLMSRRDKGKRKRIGPGAHSSVGCCKS